MKYFKIKSLPGFKFRWDENDELEVYAGNELIDNLTMTKEYYDEEEVRNYVISYCL